MQIPNPAWYCARTKPKHEHIAAANLQKNLGLEVFHPRLRMERATRRGIRAGGGAAVSLLHLRSMPAGGEHGQHPACHWDQQLGSFWEENSDCARRGDRGTAGVLESEEPMAVSDGLVAGAEVTIAGERSLGIRRWWCGHYQR